MSADPVVVNGADGEQYHILAVEKINDVLPQLGRLTVKRLRDGATIANFPAYLLPEAHWPE